LFVPVVSAVALRVAAVPPLLVVFESEPEAPAPLAVAEAEPPVPVEAAVSVRVRVASADCADPMEVDCADRDWMAEQLASIRTPLKLWLPVPVVVDAVVVVCVELV